MNVKELLHKALSIILPIGMMMGSLCLTSCEEISEVDEYDNWKVRNSEFIDSIAAVAEDNAGGDWLRILSFKLNEMDKDGVSAEYDNEDYIYCQIIEEGMGTVSPKFTDTVRVNYRGRLMPTASNREGQVFDQSYTGTFNAQTAQPTAFAVKNVIVGWSTALMCMNAGDIWRVYIPANLAYGASNKQSGVPAYSALVFDINLVDF